MRITATDIERWAATRAAQQTLPTLVRKLVSETAKTKELAMPGGDSVGRPGWDGILNATEENAWVPPGPSRWEMGCDKDIDGKAGKEFKKRTEKTGAAAAADLNFVFVTPRRWRGKDEWLDGVAGAKVWRGVRVLDADDLEAWLDTAPHTALWFAEELGLTGPGIQTVTSYWEGWRTQSKIPLTVEAISAGRQARVEAFRDALAKTPALLVIEADSTEEAVAFACAELIALGQAEAAACVTTPEGWRYVDVNPNVRIVVSASAEVASERATKAGQTLILPLNIGDRPEHFSPLAAQAAEQRIQLERPDAESFEKALIALGEDEADAARRTRSTGRSWSVYRRVNALNRAIAYPAWMHDPAARALSAIVLVGSWNESKRGDVAFLEAVTDSKYEDLERDLLHLARQNDPPVLKIGSVWKAKAPLELQHLYAKEITNDALKRFFATAEAVLTKPDPALELEPEKRWMSSVYGKVREESGIVINSIVDSLAKLSVYAEDARDERISAGIDGLVRALLDDADGARWLSLSGVLRELAEASPDVFLTAVEKSLSRPDAPILQLFAQNTGDHVFGRSWHVDLLWALETLAWSSRYLGRVVEILAQLPAPAQKNLSNRPMNSLASLLRPWWPQTTAPSDRRLKALDRLIKYHNDVAWDLLVAVMPRHQMSASANAKPHWRDDDAGAPSPNEGFGEYLVELGARIVAQAQGHPARIAKLVEDLDSFGGQYREQIIRLVETSIGFPDEDREVIRDGLRKYLNWHFTYNREERRTSLEAAERLRPQFDALAPADPVIRHTWIFRDGWVDLPDGRDNDFQKGEEIRAQLRDAALKEIYEACGWGGIDALIKRPVARWLVGQHIAGLPHREVTKWAIERFANANHPFHDPVLSGLIRALPVEERTSFLEDVCVRLDPAGVAAMASAAPCDRNTWTFVEGRGEAAVKAYWANVNPVVLVCERPDSDYAIDKLIAAKRHRTAFHSIHIFGPKVNPTRVMVLLEGIAAGAEADARMIDGHHVGEAIKFIEKAGAATQRQLALLEFAFYRGLQHNHPTNNLYKEMLAHPELFVECLTLAYGKNETNDELRRSAASQAWTVLHEGRGTPGTGADGIIDRALFDHWIEDARKQAKDKDLLTVADVNIGEWLSTCEPDADGTWPCLPVRELLERADAEHIRSGFSTGVFNNRGVHSRGVAAGGGLERDLAAQYRAYAAPLESNYPRTAAMLESIAKSYDHEARWHDNDAQLWKEGAH